MTHILPLSRQDDVDSHLSSHRPIKKLKSSKDVINHIVKANYNTVTSYPNYDKLLRSGIGYDYEEPTLSNHKHKNKKGQKETCVHTTTNNNNNWSTTTPTSTTITTATTTTTTGFPLNAFELEGTYDIILWSGIGCGGRCRNSSMGGLFSGLFDRPSFWTSQGILQFEAFSTNRNHAVTTSSSATTTPTPPTSQTRIRGTLAMGKDDLAFHSKLQFEEEDSRDFYHNTNNGHHHQQNQQRPRRTHNDEYFLQAKTTKVSFASDRVATEEHNLTSVKVRVATRTALALQSHAYRTYSSSEELVRFDSLEEAEQLLQYSQHDCSQHWLYKYTEFPKEVVVHILTFLTPPPVFFVEDGDLLLEVKSNYTDTRGYICSAKTKMIARRRK